MALDFGIGDLLSGLALLLSIYATLKTVQFNNRQQSLIGDQEKLNKLLLERETSDSASGKQANLSASFIKLGSSKYRLKIWNKGKAVARNVHLEFPEGNDVLIESEIGEKFPLEVLDIHQSVELTAAVSLDTKSKHAIRLIWSDDYSDRNEKLVYATL